METQTDAHKEAVACQVDKFIVYETITFEVNVHSVLKRLWGIAAYHRAIGCHDPFSPNVQVTTVIENALEAEALDLTDLSWGAVTDVSYAFRRLPVNTTTRQASHSSQTQISELFAGNFWIVRATGAFFEFWRLYCKNLKERELELVMLLGAGHITAALPRNGNVTQSTLPTSSKLGTKTAEQQCNEAVTAQYSQCKHGFVLISGTVDITLQPQCTRSDCISLAEVPPEAAAYHAKCHAKCNESSVFMNLESIMQQQERDYTCVQPPEYISEEHKRPCNALQELSITYFGLPEEELMIAESQPFLPTSAKLGARTKHVLNTNTVLNQERDQLSDTPVTDQELAVMANHNAKLHTSAETALQMAILDLDQHIPYTPTVYESRSCQGDYTSPTARLFDSITESAYECIDDQAVANVSDHLHRMAAIDDYYSDSGENEVEKAVDELSEVASAVVLRHAFMAMGTWLSILMLTSKHLAWAIRETFAYVILGSAQWILNKIHTIWHKPVISYLCPSMTHNSPQYKTATRQFELTSDPHYKDHSYLSVYRIIKWIERSNYDNTGSNAWCTLSQKVKNRNHVSDIFLVYRHTKHSNKHSPRALVARAITAFRQSTSSFTYQNLQAKLVSQALFIQSAEFAIDCQVNVAMAKEHGKLCGAPGCWCEAKIWAQSDCSLLACSLEHAFEVLGKTTDNLTETQMAQSIEHLQKFDGYDSFTTNLAIHRYDTNGLLASYSGSSFRRADRCYQCT